MHTLTMPLLVSVRMSRLFHGPGPPVLSNFWILRSNFPNDTENIGFINYYYLNTFCGKYTGWAKSQFTYVGLNSSVTDCSIGIILSGMTYYHHWFEEFVKSKHICVHFFQMKVHFCIYLIVRIVGSSQILLDCVWPFELRFY